MSLISIRFVSGKDATSLAIRADTKSLWSHVEAVTPDGFYLGAHADGGVQKRKPGYDATWLNAEQIIDLAETRPGQADAFYGFLNDHIGEPYDYGAILDFIIPDIEAHQQAHAICSALQTLALRSCGWFGTPLSELAHKVSPRDLMLIISGRPQA